MAGEWTRALSDSLGSIARLGAYALLAAVAGCATAQPPERRADEATRTPLTIADLDRRWLGEGSARALPDGLYMASFDGVVDPPPSAAWQERIEFAGRYILDVAPDGSARFVIDYGFDSALSGPGFATPALGSGRQLYVWRGQVEVDAVLERATLRLEPARHDQCQGLATPDFAPVAFDPSLCSSALTPLELACHYQPAALPEPGTERLRELDLFWCTIDGGHLAIDSWITLAGQVPLARRPGVHFHHEPETGHQEVAIRFP